jgi:hypothetical protein
MVCVENMTKEELEKMPVTVLGIDDDEKFLKPETQCIENDVTDGLATTCITLTYPPYSAPTKIIFEFGEVAQQVQVELIIETSDGEKKSLFIQNPVGSVVNYEPTAPKRLLVIFPASHMVTLHAVGLARVGKFELALSRRPSLMSKARSLQKLIQYLAKTKASIKTNGLDKQLLSKIQHKLMGLIRPEPKLLDPFQEIFGYNQRWSSQKAIKTAAIGCSSAGNFFMQEIADLVACGLEEMGVHVQKFNQNLLPVADAFDLVLIVAPHEFFTISCDKEALKKLRKAHQLFMLNTEQPQTKWFASALNYLKRADKVLDMNYQTALRLLANGIPARFFPLGYSQSYYNKFQPKVLARKGPMEGLPQAFLDLPTGGFTDRPIDILFVGTESARRKEFFARNAAYFAGKACFIYLPSGSDPFFSDSPATVGFEDLLGLAKRSKIVLNIHRDADQYLEWQRIVNIGIFSGAIVVSETCDSNPVLQPTYHYIDVPLCSMLQTIDHILEQPAFFSKTSQAGQAQLIRSLPISRSLNTVLSESL